MPRFTEAERTDEDRRQSKATGEQKFRQLLGPISNLQRGRVLVVSPESNETPRALKMMVSRAANEAGVKIDYREDGENLRVWLQEPRPEGEKRRGRPPKARPEAAE